MIHKYKLFGKYILLDIESGSVHEIDKITFKLLDFLKPPLEEKCPDYIFDKLKGINKRKIIESYNNIYKLYNENLIFCKENKELEKEFKYDAHIKAICLHIAHDCNLRCKYCFASTGDFGEERRELMPLEIAKQSIDFLIKNSKDRYNLEVDFFGGEPLLNYDVIVDTVKYARSLEKKHNKHFRFTVTTNGVLLDDKKIDFFNKEMDNVVLSIDGRKKVNDKMRPSINKKGTYDIIIPKFINLVNKRKDKDYYARGTFTKNNLDFSKDLIHLYKKGFKNLSIEPVISPPSESYSITENDLPKIKKEYQKLSKKLIKINKKGNDINFFHFMIDLQQGPCIVKKIKGCGAGNEYIAVTPSGEYYPCHQFVGKKELVLGNIKDGLLNQKLQDKFRDTTVYNKSKCRECWAKYYCSGGCNANNLEYCGSIFTPLKISCEMEKNRIECAMAIKAKLSG